MSLFHWLIAIGNCTGNFDEVVPKTAALVPNRKQYFFKRFSLQVKKKNSKRLKLQVNDSFKSSYPYKIPSKDEKLQNKLFKLGKMVALREIGEAIGPRRLQKRWFSNC